MVIHNTLNRGRELLERAHSGGITLDLVDGQVRMRRPESAPAGLLEEMRAERDDDHPRHPTCAIEGAA